MSNSPISISKTFFLKKKFLTFALKGNKVECPICYRKFITFLPFGSKNKRANALCINCLSLERHRLIWLYLKNETDLFQNRGPLNLLHVSPESCFFTKFKRDSRINYYPVDKFEAGYTYPKGTKNMDITSIQQESNFFDIVICNHVFETHDAIEGKVSEALKPYWKDSSYALKLVGDGWMHTQANAMWI